MTANKTKCKYPGCTIEATNTWASVPMCTDHHELIRLETGKIDGSGFYGNQRCKGRRVATEQDRIHYKQISHLIPWSKVRLGRLGAAEWDSLGLIQVLTQDSSD